MLGSFAEEPGVEASVYGQCGLSGSPAGQIGFMRTSCPSLVGPGPHSVFCSGQRS